MMVGMKQYSIMLTLKMSALCWGLCLVKDKFSVSISVCICIQASICICISISISICTCGDELSVSDTTGSVWQRAPQDKQGGRGKRTFRSFLQLFPQSLHRRTTECIARCLMLKIISPLFCRLHCRMYYVQCTP